MLSNLRLRARPLRVGGFAPTDSAEPARQGIRGGDLNP